MIVDQCNIIESPEIYPCIYDQMIFWQGCQDHSWGKEKSFQKMVLETRYTHEKKKKQREIGHLPEPYRKIISK